jgi:hypothetical protein
MIRTLTTDTDEEGRSIRRRVRVELCDAGLVEIAEEYSPGTRTRTRTEKIGAVLLTSEEAKFVRSAISEILGEPRWIERLPTLEEVSAHAAAHPCRGFGVWLCFISFPTLVGLRAGSDRRIWTDAGDELTNGLCPDARWLPCAADGASLSGVASVASGSAEARDDGGQAEEHTRITLVPGD